MDSSKDRVGPAVLRNGQRVAQNAPQGGPLIGRVMGGRSIYSWINRECDRGVIGQMPVNDVKRIAGA